MIRKTILSVCICALFVMPLAIPESIRADENAERDFTLKVLPILKAKCFGCHGGDSNDIKADYVMTNREAMMQGGESGDVALVPGDPELGSLIGAIKWDDLEMPPKENDRLSEEQVQWVENWIKQGAPWPDEKTQQRFRDEASKELVNADGMIVKTSGGTSQEWTNRRYQQEDLWAFAALNPPSVPKDENAIDYLIERRLNEAEIPSAPQADSLTLIRRATFDLLGLPPTPEEIETFQNAWQENPDAAWEALIDRLLASPHYGERWGQHWLDVARYADTAGYSNDYERSNMWRYRDYVVRAFNDDKPYHKFIIEQIAGDELWNELPKNERDSELLVATSFLRMGAWDPAMVKKPEARQLFLDDVVNAVGQTFLSTTMRCCKCHDHKFDPIPTRDYYRLYAAFSTTQMAERPAPFLATENRSGFEEGRQLVQTLLEYAQKKEAALINKRETAARKWYQENDLEYVSQENRKKLPDDQKPPRHVGLDYQDQGRLKVRTQDVWIWKRRLERYEPLVQSVYNGPVPKWLFARKLRMPEKVTPKARYVSHILAGGSLEAPGEVVQPGVLSATGIPINAQSKDPYVIDIKAAEGRRLAVAKWIANSKNPLTSRSIVNRIWQYHFGKAIAGNPNSFGAKGAKPTHPKLLDWLADDFIRNGWVIKRVHRLIMTSRTYRQASRHPETEKLRTKDPNNDLLAYFPVRRLSAEEVRDAMLRITGELNAQIGGLPAMPEINMEVALQPRMIQFSLAPAYQPSQTPQARNRRSLYAYRVRGQANPFLEVFNQPNPNESCESRDSAAVSPQAFTLMNSEMMSDRAIAFALRIQNEAKSRKEQMTRAFELAFGRKPSTDELSRLGKYVSRMLEYHRTVAPDETTYPTEITRSLVEEFSGRPFEYQEILPAFRDYTPDKKPSDVNAETRALADVCLLLFNSNEFLFIY